MLLTATQHNPLEFLACFFAFDQRVVREIETFSRHLMSLFRRVARPRYPVGGEPILSFRSALQHAVPQFAEFAIQEMAASKEGQNGATTLHDFGAETL